MKKILIALAAVFTLVSCEMDFYRSDTMTSTMLGENPGAAVYTTDGVYSMFKDVLEYQGSEYSGNQYVRHLFLMSELHGDNVVVSFASSDPFFEVHTYVDNPQLYNLGYFWYCAYKIIYGANSNIEAIKEGASPESDHMLGENYFIRAIVHLHLSTLYSRPYTRGRDNMGVVLRTSTDCSTTERATVGQVYDQIVDDLKNAIRLMENKSRGSNKGYANYEAARGLLTRVYLYMGMDKECAELADQMLGSNPAANLEQGYENIYNYFINARTSKETLWCVGRSITDHGYSAGSQMGSMYYKPIIGTTSSGDLIQSEGWGEFSYTDKLMDLYERYPEDYRYNAYRYKMDIPTPNDIKEGYYTEGVPMLTFSVETESKGDAVTVISQMPVRGKNVTYNAANDSYTFKYADKTYTAQSKMVNKDKVYYLTTKPDPTCPTDKDGHVRVYVRDYVRDNSKGFPAFFMRKFAEQDGETQLCSPVMIRWAEVILNRAEANAKLGNDKAALDDLNVLRKRAGLPDEAMYTTSNYKDYGYAKVLDVVLDERNLELCFEGHRAFDLYRNNMAIDRRYPGLQKYEEVTVEFMDANFPLCIPFNEVSVSGIPNNK